MIFWVIGRTLRASALTKTRQKLLSLSVVTVFFNEKSAAKIVSVCTSMFSDLRFFGNADTRVLLTKSEKLAFEKDET